MKYAAAVKNAFSGKLSVGVNAGFADGNKYWPFGNLYCSRRERDGIDIARAVQTVPELPCRRYLPDLEIIVGYIRQGSWAAIVRKPRRDSRPRSADLQVGSMNVLVADKAEELVLDDRPPNVPPSV